MAALIIESSNPSNLKLLAELAEKLGDRATPIASAEIEDLLLGKILTNAKTGEYVDEEEVMLKLSSK